MANIILIDEDDRVRRQMEMFLSELGEENRVRSFKSFKEFESLYFKSTQGSGVKLSFPDHPQLRLLSPEQQAWLLDQKFAKDSPFPFPSFKIDVDEVSGKVKKLDPRPNDDINLFGHPMAEFQLKSQVLESTLPAIFQKSFSDVVSKATNTKPSEGLIAFYSATNDIWILQLKVTKSPQTVHFQIEDLTSKLVEAITKVKEKQADKKSDDDEMKLLSQIDLFIVKAVFMPKKPTAWIDQLHASLKKFSLYPAEFRTRLIITKYEDDGVDKIDLTHPHVDDVIFLPLDRMIFLQKVEILLGLPKTVSPSYLFSQEVKLEIEIAKRSWMEKLSDVALAIRNPVPLVSGLIGHFYVDLTGEKDSLEVYGKVVKSEPHPAYPGEHLVYFGFFSMPKDTQTRLRRYLSKDNHYTSLVNDNKRDFAFNPDDLFLSNEEKRAKNIIVVDGDDDSYTQILDVLQEDVEQIQVAAFNTYSAFLNKYFDDKQVNVDITNLQAAQPKDVFGGQATFIITMNEKELVDFTPPAPNTTLLGYTSDDLFKEKQNWKKIFSQKDHEPLLEEIYKFVETGRHFKSIVFFTDVEQKSKALEVKAHQGQRGIQFTFSIAKNEEVKEFILLQSKFTNWDLLIIDAALMPTDPTEWISNMETNAKAKGYLKEHESLKIIAIDHANSKRKVKDYRQPQIRSLLQRPIEPRSFLFNVSAALELPYTVYRFNNIGWSNSRLSVQVAKEANLQSLAEYGANVRHPRPIAPGTFLYLRGSIFDNAPRKNLCARFYACEEDPNEKGSYICSLIYFGINEAFTKFARSWFRETYAASKQVEG